MWTIAHEFGFIMVGGEFQEAVIRVNITYLVDPYRTPSATLTVALLGLAGAPFARSRRFTVRCVGAVTSPGAAVTMPLAPAA